MSFAKNRRTGFYEADVHDRKVGRLHVSLATKRRTEAARRYAAVVALVREGDASLVAELRARRVNVAEITRLHAERIPFATLRPETPGVAPWPTVSRAVEAYLAYMPRAQRADSTLDHARGQLEKFAAFMGERALDQVREEDVARWQEALSRTLQPSSVRIYLRRVAALYRWFVTQERKRAERERRAARFLPLPIDEATVPREKGGRPRFLSAEEVARLWRELRPELRVPFLLGVHAGLRLNEVVTLRPPPFDFDLEFGIVRVQEKDIGKKQPWRPKSRKPRDVPMTPELRAAVDAHLAVRGAVAWMFESAIRPDRPMSDKTLAAAFESAVRSAGLPVGQRTPQGVTFHTLRHTYGSHLVMAGVDLVTVKQLMGHASIITTERYYAHLLPSHKQQSAALLSARLPVSLSASDVQSDSTTTNTTNAGNGSYAAV